MKVRGEFVTVIKSFEEIESWKESRILCSFVYKSLTSKKDYSYNDQLKRASVSIMNNIAEGFERQTNKGFKQFLYIAKGSPSEVRSMSLLGLELGYFSKSDSDYIYSQTVKISKLLPGLIKVL